MLPQNFNPGGVGQPGIPQSSLPPHGQVDHHQQAPPGIMNAEHARLWQQMQNQMHAQLRQGVGDMGGGQGSNSQHVSPSTPFRCGQAVSFIWTLIACVHIFTFHRRSSTIASLPLPIYAYYAHFTPPLPLRFPRAAYVSTHCLLRFRSIQMAYRLSLRCSTSYAPRVTLDSKCSSRLHTSSSRSVWLAP